MSATHIHATVRATHATPPRARSRGVRFAQPSIAALPKTSTTRCPGLSSRGALRGDDALAADCRANVEEAAPTSEAISLAQALDRGATGPETLGEMFAQRVRLECSQHP